MMVGNRKSLTLILCMLAILAVSLSSCDSILPVRLVPEEDQSPLFKAPTFLPTAAVVIVPTATSSSNSSPTGECTNLLEYVSDITFPDFTEVKTDEIIDKQWEVKNAGTCNWDSGYSLQQIGGQSMGASSPQALVPARNGTVTVISIQFTVPEEPGRYYSQWKAFSPTGQSFGDVLYIDIYVIAP